MHRWAQSILTLVAALLILGGVAHGKKKPPAHPIDINEATVKELEELPGVGPTTAKAIIEFRITNRPLPACHRPVGDPRHLRIQAEEDAPLHHDRPATEKISARRKPCPCPLKATA